MPQKTIKAIVLLSGGLDSMLAAKVLMMQNIKVQGVSFKSYFFGAKLAKKAAEELKIKLKVVDISDKQLEIVKHPKYGYGKAINPCIDCHILMLKKAGELMRKQKFDFIATGEVLGERPMSQNKKSMEIIERESGLEGYLLRPLSAKLLPETMPEKESQVEREKLFSIFGRSRKKQIELAKKWGIKNYPTPAGGCILTDLEFAKRLRELLKRCPKCEGEDVRLLRYGRIFWNKKTIVVLSRNEKEGKGLESLAKPKDMLLELKNYPGPLALVRSFANGVSEGTVEKAKDYIKHYAKKNPRNKKPEFLIRNYE